MKSAALEKRKKFCNLVNLKSMTAKDKISQSACELLVEVYFLLLKF